MVSSLRPPQVRSQPHSRATHPDDALRTGLSMGLGLIAGVVAGAVAASAFSVVAGCAGTLLAVGLAGGVNAGLNIGLHELVEKALGWDPDTYQFSKRDVAYYAVTGAMFPVSAAQFLTTTGLGGRVVTSFLAGTMQELMAQSAASFVGGDVVDAVLAKNILVNSAVTAALGLGFELRLLWQVSKGKIVIPEIPVDPVDDAMQALRSLHLLQGQPDRSLEMELGKAPLLGNLKKEFGHAYSRLGPAVWAKGNRQVALYHSQDPYVGGYVLKQMMEQEQPLAHFQRLVQMRKLMQDGEFRHVRAVEPLAFGDKIPDWFIQHQPEGGMIAKTGAFEVNANSASLLMRMAGEGIHLRDLSKYVRPEFVGTVKKARAYLGGEEIVTHLGGIGRELAAMNRAGVYHNSIDHNGNIRFDRNWNRLILELYDPHIDLDLAPRVAGQGPSADFTNDVADYVVWLNGLKDKGVLTHAEFDTILSDIKTTPH